MVLFYSNSHFQYISVRFERISLINFFSLVLAQGWGFRAFSHMNFAPGARVMQPFFARGVGISPPQKNPSVVGLGEEMLTAGID